MVAAVLAITRPHCLPCSHGEVPQHVRAERLLAIGIERGKHTIDFCARLVAGRLQTGEARDGNGPNRIGYIAVWEKENANPALISFLKLLRERYPVALSNVP